MMLVLGIANETVYKEQFPELTFYRNTPFQLMS